MLKARLFSSLKIRPKNSEKVDKFRIVVMGAAAVGKSSIISQFLYDRFVGEYKETIEELHQSSYKVKNVHLELDILDTSGVYPFPAMRKLAISTSDAFILVYSVNNASSFDEVIELRQQIIKEKKNEHTPIVIVANKIDIMTDQRIVRSKIADTLVSVEWGNGYIEASAKDNVNITGIFKEILRQSNVKYPLTPVFTKRRVSLPAVYSTKTKR